MANFFRLPYWNEGRLPTIPTVILVDNFDVEAEQRLEFLRSCLWHAAADKTWRTVTGFNRALQNMFPDEKITIRFTEVLCQIWQHAGAQSLIDAARKGFRNDDGTRVFCFNPWPCLKRFACMEIAETEALEFFYLASFIVKLRYPDDPLYNNLRTWKLFAEDQYGKYLAFVASDQQPTEFDARSICQWHFRVDLPAE